MKPVKVGLMLLLVFVTVGSMVTLVVAEDLKPNNSHQQSLNDLFNISEIKKRTEKHSKEEIQKKYEEILKKSKEQYRRAIQEIEECKLELPEVKDDETDLVSSKSYYHADYTADDGTSAHGGSGVGNSDAWINSNEIHIWSRAEGPYGDYWAHGRVWDRFTYYATDHWCKVKVNYYLRGRLLSLGGDNDISIYLRVYDVTTGTEVDKRLIFNNEGNAYYDNVLKSGQTMFS